MERVKSVVQSRHKDYAFKGEGGVCISTLLRQNQEALLTELLNAKTKEGYYLCARYLNDVPIEEFSEKEHFEMVHLLASTPSENNVKCLYGLITSNVFQEIKLEELKKRLLEAIKKGSKEQARALCEIGTSSVFTQSDNSEHQFCIIECIESTLDEDTINCYRALGKNHYFMASKTVLTDEIIDVVHQGDKRSRRSVMRMTQSDSFWSRQDVEEKRALILMCKYEEDALLLPYDTLLHFYPEYYCAIKEGSDVRLLKKPILQ